jgi:hypothetical protein
LSFHCQDTRAQNPFANSLTPGSAACAAVAAALAVPVHCHVWQGLRSRARSKRRVRRWSSAYSLIF